MKINNIKSNYILFLIFNIILVCNSFAQNNSRINDNNNIGWFNFNSTIKVSSKFSLNLEYQWRRDEYIRKWEQSLLRTGVSFNLNPNVQFRVGYGWIETFPYGDYPINVYGKDFTEHRIYEMITLNNKMSIIDFSHRFMLEQRLVGRYSNANLATEDEFLLLNRLRYMIRLQIPLKGKSIDDKTPYLATFNEIFIGFGKNVNENIFDQNRLAILLGYKFNKNLKIEAGYLNQTLQLGREITGKNVFQNNNGFLVNTIMNFDFTKLSNSKN